MDIISNKQTSKFILFTNPTHFLIKQHKRCSFDLWPYLQLAIRFLNNTSFLWSSHFISFYFDPKRTILIFISFWVFKLNWTNMKRAKLKQFWLDLLILYSYAIMISHQFDHLSFNQGTIIITGWFGWMASQQGESEEKNRELSWNMDWNRWLWLYGIEDND